MKLPHPCLAAALAALCVSSSFLPAQTPLAPPAGEVSPAVKTELMALAARLRGGKDALVALRPNSAQIEQLAANADDAKKLTAYVEKIYSSLPPAGLPIKAEQTEVLVPASLPGGYAGAVARFRPGVTFYGVKFVKPGETLGFALDGFIKLDGRWVMIPKAWRAFEEQ